MKWGFDPIDKGCARVFFFDAPQNLTAAELPKDLVDDFRFPQLKISVEPCVSVPSFEDFVELGGNVDWEDFEEARAQCICADETGEVSRLLGYPDVIQSSMEQECEIVTRGFYLGDAKMQIPENIQTEIEADAQDWTLLFQMGTVQTEGFELMFGDCGYIYFWIKKQDLAARNFDNVWLVLQCW